MENETTYLSNEEALEEMRAEERGELAEASQAEKPQEPRTRTRKEQDGADQSKKKKKIRRPLTTSRKPRQGNESNVGEPRKKDRKAIKTQTAGAAKQVPSQGKQGQGHVSRAGRAGSILFARERLVMMGPYSVASHVTTAVMQERARETHLL